MTETDFDDRAEDIDRALESILDAAGQPPTIDRLRNRIPALEPQRSRTTRRTVRRTAVVGSAIAAAIALIAVIVPAGTGLGLSTAAADPQVVLNDAARIAANAPDVIPRPDQFYFIELENGAQYWLSMDGTHDGLAKKGSERTELPGCRAGVPAGCVADPAFVGDAPNSGPAMRDYLTQRFGDAGLNGIGKGAGSLLMWNYLSSDARAAVFDALSTFDGLRAVEGGPIPKGLVGITWSVAGADNETTDGQSSTTLLFDKANHSYAGVTTLGVDGEQGHGEAPKVTSIVDEVGQLPAER